MRYIVQTSLSHEISARREYLYDTFKLWFWISGSSDRYIELCSMPSSEYSDTLFIVGHNRFVKDLILSSCFSEKTIVAITCDGCCNFRFIRLPAKQQLFLPYLNKSGMAELLDGQQFGFDFDITESEIQFYNTPHKYSLYQRIQSAFTRFQ